LEKIIDEMMTQNLFDRNTGVQAVAHVDHVDQAEPVTERFHQNDKAVLCDLGLGICSVPMQEWEPLYDEDTAFSAGTIFPCLDKPFLGGGR